MINIWDGITREEAVAIIKKEKSKLEEIEILIENYNELLKRDPNSFAYKLSIETLKVRENYHQANINNVLAHRKYEIFDFSLKGDPFQSEFGDFLGLSGTLHFLQQTFSSIIQAITSGPTIRGKIPSGILNLSKLSLIEVFPSSFGLKIAIKNDLDLFGESYSIQGINYLFQLINSGDQPDKLYELFALLGPRTLSNYKKLISHFCKLKSSFKFKWIDPCENDFTAETTQDCISKTEISLSKLRSKNESISEFYGYLLGASLIRKRFELSMDSGDVITGSVPRENLEPLAKLFGMKVKVILVETQVSDDMGNILRTNYTLNKIEKAT